MALFHRFRFATLLAVFTLIFSSVAVDFAEARRGGGFGSRGARTFQSAPATTTAPSAAPVQRSVTPNQATRPGAAAPAAGAAAAARGGFLSSPLARGLLLGGLFGMLMGYGFGGMAGMLGLLLQIALIAGLAWLALRFFRSRSQPATAGAPNHMAYDGGHKANEPRRDFRHLGAGLGGGGANAAQAPQDDVSVSKGDELGITPADLDIFEQRLHALQDAFGREDYAAIREITTPEIMSYLSEELSQNATRGLKSEVRDVTLLQGDVAESWKEGSREYATVAMRYSMIQFLRDRQSGEVVEGSDEEAVESTEVWTFLRDHQDEWKLTAIQDA